MIQISERAQHYFCRLIEQQGDDDFGIRMAVESAGTPAARVDLNFCETDDLIGDEKAVECQGFTLYVAADSVEWLEEGQVDFEPQRAGGQLRISAPGIGGHVPKADADLVAKLRYLIESEINPQLASHGGQVSLVEINAEKVAILEFGGGCHGCGMVDVTLKQGVEKTLRKRLPEISGVRDVTEHAKGKTPYYKSHDGQSAMG